MAARAQCKQPLFIKGDASQCVQGATVHQGNGGRHASQEQQQQPSAPRVRRATIEEPVE
jgi:hypothetical protein